MVGNRIQCVTCWASAAEIFMSILASAGFGVPIWKAFLPNPEWCGEKQSLSRFGGFG